MNMNNQWNGLWDLQEGARTNDIPVAYFEVPLQSFMIR